MSDKATEKRNLPIACFDSGVGGLSVLREAVRLMPEEDFIFFGDSANAPYGTKTVKQIQDLTMEHIDRLAHTGDGIKAIVIACNTATSAAIGLLRETYTDIPVVGIEPAVKPAALMGEHPRVLALMTPLTAKGGKLKTLIDRYKDHADITALGCPGLMEFAESGQTEGEEVDRYLQDLFAPYRSEKIDAVVLGCTHYPFLKDAIRKAVGDGPAIIDGGAGTARELHRRLEEEGLLTDRTRPGQVTLLDSKPEKIELMKRLMAQ